MLGRALEGAPAPASSTGRVPSKAWPLRLHARFHAVYSAIYVPVDTMQFTCHHPTSPATRGSVLAYPLQTVELSREVQRLISAGRVTKVQGEDVYQRHKGGVTPIERAIFELRLLEKANGFEPSAEFINDDAAPVPAAASVFGGAETRMAIKSSPEVKEVAEEPPTPPTLLPGSGSVPNQVVVGDLPSVPVGGGGGDSRPWLRPGDRVFEVGKPPTGGPTPRPAGGIDIYGTGTVFQVPVSKTTQDPEAPLNLTDVVGQVIGGVTQYQIAKATGGSNFVQGTTPAFTDTLYDYFTDAAGNVVAAQPKCKKRRRRRRMLVTPGELNQLAALQGVLGKGEAFKTWIATRKV